MGKFSFHIIRVKPDFSRCTLKSQAIAYHSTKKNRLNQILRQLSLLVLVTPEEAPHSGSSIEFDHPLPAFPIPDFSEEGVDQWENGHGMNGTSPNGEAVLVALEAQEVDAVK